MDKKKLLLVVFAILFFVFILIVSYDISRRTTFPGSKPQLQDRIEKEYLKDTVSTKSDTIEKL